jgi:hypothetical protein
MAGRAVSRQARRLHFEAMKNIQAATGVITKSAALSDYVMGLCESAVSGKKQAKRLKALARAVRVLQEKDATPPMPRYKPGQFEELQATEWVSRLNKVMPPVQVNGHDLKREVRPYGQQSE